MSVPLVLEQAGGSLYGVSTLLMRTQHGCRIRQVVRRRSTVLRAPEHVRRCVVRVQSHPEDSALRCRFRLLHSVASFRLELSRSADPNIAEIEIGELSLVQEPCARFDWIFYGQ